jgi:hypothetical protein
MGNGCCLLVSRRVIRKSQQVSGRTWEIKEDNDVVAALGWGPEVGYFSRYCT